MEQWLLVLVVLSGRYCEASPGRGFPDGLNELNDIVVLALADEEKLSFLLTTIAVVVNTFVEGVPAELFTDECIMESAWFCPFTLGIEDSGFEMADKSGTLADKFRKLDVFDWKDGLAATAGG